MPDHSLDTEGRLRLLEASVETQEEILAAIQAERIEAERLNDSVTRLGMGASDLGAALLQVDKTQQMLTKLGQDISRVEAESVTEEQVAEKVRLARQELLNYRKNQVAKAYGWGVGVLTMFLVFAVVAAGYVQHQRRQEHENCLSRAATSQAVKGYLDVVVENSTNPKIRDRAAQILVAIPPTNAEDC